MANAPHIVGRLGEDDFVELLEVVATGKRTGTLVVRRKGAVSTEKRVAFRRGRILATESTDPREFLGHFLVGHGFLDEETLSRAIQMQDANGMLLGRVLLDLGAISEPELEEMLRLQARETVLDLFTWEAADFEFRQGELPDSTLIPLALDVETLTRHGTERAEQHRRIRQLIPSGHCVPVAVGRLDAPPTDPRAARVLELIDDDRTVEEIALEAHVGEFGVGRVLLEQILAGRVKVVRPRFVDRERPRGRPPVPAGILDDRRAATATGPLATARGHLANGELGAAHGALLRALAERPDDVELRREAGAFCDDLRAALRAAGLEAAAVPRPVDGGGAPSATGISAEEAFLLSRLDGRYDVSAILKITPMEPLAALVALWRLARDGYLALS